MKIRTLFARQLPEEQKTGSTNSSSKPTAVSAKDRAALSKESRAPETSATNKPDLSWATEPAEVKKRLELPHRTLRERDPDTARVKKLQQLLNKRGAKLVVDGKFGPGTKSAVAAFQRGGGVKANGRLGKRTLRSLNRGLPAEEQLDLPEISLRRGMRDKKGDYVSGLQQMLNEHGGAELEVDGAFGSKTQAAVKAFQEKQGLEPTGVVDGRTRDALNESAEPVPGDKQGWGEAVTAKSHSGNEPAPIAKAEDLSKLSMKERRRLLKVSEKPLPLTADLKKNLPGAVKTLEKLAGEDRVWDPKDRANNLVQLKGAVKKGAHREIDKRFDQEVAKRADQSWVSRNVPILKPVVRGLYGLGAESQREDAHKTFGDQAVRLGQEQALFDLNDGFREMGMSPGKSLDAASRRRALKNGLPQVSEEEMSQLKDVFSGLQKQSGKLDLPKGAFKNGLSVDFLKSIQEGKPMALAGVAAHDPKLYEAASKALPLNDREHKDVKAALGTLRKLAGKDGVWDRGDVSNNVRQLDGELRQEVRKRIDKEFDRRFDGEFNRRFNKEFDKKFRAEAGKEIRREIDRRIAKSPALRLLSAFPGGRSLMESKGWAEARKRRPGIYAKERKAARAKYYPIEKAKAHKQYTTSGMKAARKIAGKELNSGLDKIGVDGSGKKQQWSDELGAINQAELNQLQRTLTSLQGKLKEAGFEGDNAGLLKGLPVEFLEYIEQGKAIGLLGVMTR